MSAAPDPMSDMFTKFWSDFMSRMAPPGMAPPAGMSQDGTKQMQRIFFDALAKYADDFMRSPQFLEALKQTMDNAMAFRRQLDGFLTTMLKSAQMPTQSDTAYITEMLHGMERRLSARIDEVAARLDAVEKDHARGAAKAAGRGRVAARKAAGR